MNRPSSRFHSVLSYLSAPSSFNVKAMDLETLRAIKQEAEIYNIGMLRAKVNTEILFRAYPEYIKVELKDTDGLHHHDNPVDDNILQMARPLEGLYKKQGVPGDDDRPGYGKESLSGQWFYYENNGWCFDTTLTDSHPMKKMVDILPIDDCGAIELRSNPTDIHLTFENIGYFQDLLWSGTLSNIENEEQPHSLTLVKFINLRFKFTLVHNAEFLALEP